MREDLAVIRITKETKERITALAKETGYKEITVLEYLIKGKLKFKQHKEKQYDKT